MRNVTSLRQALLNFHIFLEQYLFPFHSESPSAAESPLFPHGKRYTRNGATEGSSNMMFRTSLTW